MGHVVLLGDSVLDNGAYTAGGPDVAAHLRHTLPPGWRATLLALDASFTHQVPSQLARLPQDATHLVISEATGAGLPLIDLRRVCTEDADYANPIEPSATGGARIARAIARVVQEHDFSRGLAAVYT